MAAADRKSGIYYIGNHRCMYQYVSKTSTNKCVKMMNIPEWVDIGSAVTSHTERVVIVGGWNRWNGDARALLLDMTGDGQERELPDLPEPCYSAGVVLFDNDVYVVGGGNGKKKGDLSSVYYLSLVSNAWQTKESMPHAVISPLVIQHQHSIYVLGGFNGNNNQQSSVSQYSIKNSKWIQCSDMPVACNCDDAGVVVHEDRIKVITEDKCLMYDDDTDTWTVKQYSKLGNSVNAFVRGEQIYAVVSNGGRYSMMSYDDVDNVWKTEHNRIGNALQTWFFC